MRKGFTLLELIVVIIIIGILATLGFTQYSRMIEKARGAEARAILGDIRKLAIARVMEIGVANVGTITDANLNIGATLGQDIPGPAACLATHYFRYSATKANPMVITATRCVAGGKNPQGVAGNTLSLTYNFTTGLDTWGPAASVY